ncbi:MAG TPA: twin-arginine translocase subunit TatC [Planctomycetes bacterium]|nr:twin-arginine translocase subunit TatC [Planctomycetota bacterium]HIJ71987.1 twin-arginine translocase subunit TatC [Planctomycetota bacterium]
MDKNAREELKTMSLGDHLEELRARLIMIILGLFAGMVFCLFFGKFFVGLLTAPFSRTMNTPDVIRHLQTIEPAEGFIVYIKVCLVFGLLITSPWVFWQIWAFVSSGLYRHERKFIHVVAPVSAALFITGAVFFLLVVAPIALGVFIRFNERLKLASNWTFRSYINLVLTLAVVFGAAFQMPIAIVFAERMKLIPLQNLIKARKFVILGLVIAAAMATPPDPVSLVALAVPLYVLFEGSILICRFLQWRKSKSR